MLPGLAENGEVTLLMRLCVFFCLFVLFICFVCFYELATRFKLKKGLHGVHWARLKAPGESLPRTAPQTSDNIRLDTLRGKK